MINYFSYVDPATTALVWQILAGIVITLGVVLGIWWRKVTTFFKSIFAKIFGKSRSEQKEDELEKEISELDEDELSKETSWLDADESSKEISDTEADEPSKEISDTEADEPSKEIFKNEGEINKEVSSDESTN